MNIELQNKIVARTRECFDIANARLHREYAYPTITFDLRGTTAGQAFLQSQHIKYNPILSSENEAEFFSQTIPHEVSHLICYLYYHTVRAHGPEWKSIMRNVYGLEPLRCHSMNVENARVRRTMVHIYRCSCGMDLRVGTCQHNKIQNNIKVIHVRCGTVIDRFWHKESFAR